MSNDDYFEVEDAEVIHETDKAIRVEAPDLEEPLWVPKSSTIIMDDSEVWDGSIDGCGPGTLILAMWWADKQGLG